MRKRELSEFLNVQFSINILNNRRLLNCAILLSNIFPVLLLFEINYNYATYVNSVFEINRAVLIYYISSFQIYFH